MVLSCLVLPGSAVPPQHKLQKLAEFMVSGSLESAYQTLLRMHLMLLLLCIQ